MRFWRYRDRDEVVAPDGLVRPVGPSTADVKDAYEKGHSEGRATERSRHRSHPILMFLLLVLAVIGAIMVYLAVRHGGFAGAGQAADQQIAVAKSEAPGVIHQAGQSAGQAARTVADKVNDANAKVTNNNAAPSR